MADEQIRVDVRATDNASDVLDDVADRAERVERESPEIDVTADTGQARSELDQVTDETRRLDRENAEVEIRAETDRARQRLRELRDELRRLKGDDARIEAKVDVDDSELDGLAGKLSDLAGPIGVGAVTAGVAGLVNNAKDAAIEVGVLRDLTGDTLEGASRLAEVWRTAGIDVDDLIDIILQMNDTLADSPELASRLRINLDDGRSGGERFVQVVDKLNQGIGDADERARLMAELFGEEGVRQVGRVNIVVGDLGEAIDDVPELNIVTEEGLDRAVDYERTMRDVDGLVRGITTRASSYQPGAGDGSPFGALWRWLAGDDGGEQVVEDIERRMFDVAGWQDEVNERMRVAIERTRAHVDAENELETEQREAYEAQDRHLRDLAGKSQELRNRVDDIRYSFEDLESQIENDRSVTRLERRFEDYEDAAADALEKTESGADDARDAVRRHEDAVYDLKQEVIRYADELGDIPSEVVSDIVADIDSGSIDSARRTLDDLTRTRTIRITPVFGDIQGARGPSGIPSWGTSNRAAPAASTTNVYLPRGYRDQGAAIGAARAARRSGRLYASR